MVMAFRYKRQRRIKRPLIEIALIGQKRADVKGLVDSGADTSAICLKTARILGLNVEGRRSLSWGVEGSVECVDSSVSIEIEGENEKHNFSIPIKVVMKEEEEFPIILGREGFFDKFLIIFNEREKEVILIKS